MAPNYIPMSNPLLEDNNLPPFAEIRPEHAEPAVRRLIERNKAAIEKLLASGGPFDWDSLLQPIEELEDDLARCWSPIGHLNAVMNSDALRAAYNACIGEL